MAPAAAVAADPVVLPKADKAAKSVCSPGLVASGETAAPAAPAARPRSPAHTGGVASQARTAADRARANVLAADPVAHRVVAGFDEAVCMAAWPDSKCRTYPNCRRVRTTRRQLHAKSNTFSKNMCGSISREPLKSQLDNAKLVIGHTLNFAEAPRGMYGYENSESYSRRPSCSGTNVPTVVADRLELL
ncbi:hypothetical protein LAUMK42_05597 [Mycobacterium persicum]|uniref:Uncharacterized protein n=1 Tax=Mycobacterium persicum TaxID=1487726 RepID=A0AB38V1W8_9MYCO|nr:hypothetical protein LAUMK42_05597 [Mycobacterium persicum]